MVTQFLSCNYSWSLSYYVENITQNNCLSKWYKPLLDLFKLASSKEISSLISTLSKTPLSMQLKYFITTPNGSSVKVSPSIHGLRLNLSFMITKNNNVLSFFSKLIYTTHLKSSFSKISISKYALLSMVRKFKLPKSHFFNIKLNLIKSPWWASNFKSKKEVFSNLRHFHLISELMAPFINKPSFQHKKCQNSQTMI